MGIVKKSLLTQFMEKWYPKIQHDLPQGVSVGYLAWCLFYLDGNKSPYLTREEMIDCCFEYFKATQRHVNTCDARERAVAVLVALQAPSEEWERRGF